MRRKFLQWMGLGLVGTLLGAGGCAPSLVSQTTGTVMKITKQDRSLVLREFNFWPVVSGVAIGGIVAGWTGMFLYVVGSLGTRSISCERVEPKIVNCIVKNKERSETVYQVSKAILDTETSNNDDGDTTYTYSLSLQSTRSLVKVDTGIGFTRAASWRAKEYFEQINGFLASEQQNLVLSNDTRFDFENYLAILLYSVFAFGAILGFWIIIDWCNFITSWNFDRSQRKIFFSQANLLNFFRGSATKEVYALDDVLSIEILNSQDPEDSESTPSYSVALVRSNDYSVPNIDLNYNTGNLKKQQQVASALGEFLGLRVILEPILTNKKNLVYAGKKDEYIYAGSLEELKDGAELFQLLQLSKSIEELGFTPLNLLKMQKHSGIQIAGYARELANTYATIMFTTEVDMDKKNKFALKVILRGQEFYTTFSSGASLTTSTVTNTSDIPEKQIFRNSYPDTSVDELYRLHKKRIEEIVTQHGKPNPVRAELKSLAIAIDDYLVREAIVA